MGVQWQPFNDTQKTQQAALLNDVYVDALRKLAPDTGAYVNEVRLPIARCRLANFVSRHFLMSPTFKKPSGELIIHVYWKLREKLTQTMYSGATHVLATRDGR